MAKASVAKASTKASTAKAGTVKASAVKPATSRESDVIERLDAEVDAFMKRCRYFYEPMTKNRAKMFVINHRQNTRYRNSVLKLRVATNTPDWDTKINVIGACAQEIIADHEHGGGRAHWEVLEQLGVTIGMKLSDIRAAQPLDSTRMCWAAWKGLMSNEHWLEGIVANTCAERANVPGYGKGDLKKKGWFGVERARWGELFKLKNEQLDFFELHEEADIEHSNMGWAAVARFASEMRMEEQVVEACRVNLIVWEHYLNGIGAGGDAL